MLSSWATSTIEEVMSAMTTKSGTGGVLWLQLYIYKNRELTLSLVQRAEKAGYKAIFVTVDTPYLGRRWDDMRNRFKLPPHLRWVEETNIPAQKNGTLLKFLTVCVCPQHVQLLNSVSCFLWGQLWQWQWFSCLCCESNRPNSLLGWHHLVEKAYTSAFDCERNIKWYIWTQSHTHTHIYHPVLSVQMLHET